MCTQETIKFWILDNAHYHQPILRCGFLIATDYALKRPKALKYGILPQWKPNLKHFFTVPVFLIDPWTW